MARMSSILQSHGTMDPNLNLHLSFQDTPFCLITCLFALIRLSLIVHSFACFLPSCFFACLLACFLCHCMYTLEARTLGVRVQLLRHEPKGQGCKQEDASPKRAMFSRLGGLASSCGYLSLSQPFLRALFQGSHPYIQLQAAFLG